MLLTAVLFATLAAGIADGAGAYFTIAVVDEQTGRGVPLVELRTVDNMRYLTDSNGLVAFHEPGLMDQSVFFHVRSHGYEFAADKFGFHGRALQTVPGGTAELRLRRINIAERLYRVTGQGIYRDTLLLNRPAPLARPLLNAQVVGSDSVNSIFYRGQVHWFWGDTNRAGYPLGTFHVPGAVSRLPADGGLAPEVGVDLTYFTRDDGFAASTCEMPGEGPTWIDGLCVIRDSERGERMFAKYVKVRKFLEVYEGGLVEFNAAQQKFEKVTTFDFSAPVFPHGHSLLQSVAGDDYVYFGNPYPVTRVRAQPDALRDPAQYEVFTCLASGSRLDKPRIDRGASGAVHYAWKRNTSAPTPREQAKWVKSGLLSAAEGLLARCDVETGDAVAAHAGSVAWNAFRKRFVMIAEQSGGTSSLGEVWYAEAPAPTGPWVYAAKIVTHDKYSFYNPKQHAMFDQEGGRRIYFEGTYSTFFSGNNEPTPLYEYNQIMYRLDLADPRLTLPVPVYAEMVDGRQVLTTVPTAKEKKIVCMALDRPRDATVALVEEASPSGTRRWVVRAAQAGASAARGQGAFHALPADSPNPAQTTVALYAWNDELGRQVVAVDGEAGPEGYVRAEKPLCRVWRFPLTGISTWE